MDEKPLTAETLHLIFARLQLMRCSAAFLWTEQNNHDMQNYYAVVLLDKPDSMGRWLVDEMVKRFAWRPEPAELEALMQMKMEEGDYNAA